MLPPHAPTSLHRRPIGRDLEQALAGGHWHSGRFMRDAYDRLGGSPVLGPSNGSSRLKGAGSRRHAADLRTYKRLPRVRRCAIYQSCILARARHGPRVIVVRFTLYHDQMVSSTGRLVLPPLCSAESGSTPLYPLPPLPPFLEKTSATDSQVSENTVYQT